MADEASALRRQRLGARLRALREAHDMTGDQVGRAIARSASWISRVESGLIALRRRDLQELLDLYDVHDDTVRAELERMATGRQPQGWWSRYRSVVPEPYGTLIGLEAEASSIRSYENAVFPGIIQTEAYARVIFENNALNRTPQEITDSIAVRVRRQEVLRKADAPGLSVVVPESVINQIFGNREVMVGQLEAVMETALRPAVEVLVIPYGQAAPAIPVAGFVVLEFPEDPPIAYVENLTGGTIIRGRSVAVYEEQFQRLRRLAAPPEDSIDMILKARDHAGARSGEN